MSKHEKTLQKLTAKPTPTDIKWDDLVSALKSLGYEPLNNSGSRRKFFHHERKHVISLHEPHPQNVIKQYVARQLAEELTAQGFI